MIPGLSPELLDAAKAIGLLDASGDLAADWFVQPIRYLSQILSEPGQRAALLDLLDVLFPPAAIAGAPADEKWHPLLGDQSGGGFYFTVRDTAGNITLGAAGDIGRVPGTTLRLKLPAVSLNGGISAVAGTADGPLSVELRVPLPLPAAGVVPLAAVRVTGLLTLLPAPAENLQVVLEGLDLDGTGPRDTALDVGSLDQQALQLVLGLVRRLLICWEPFHYDVQIGVQVGISVRVHICFFGCVNIELTLSRGASVHIIGPPLHGEVTVDAYVTSITIPFGPNPNPKPNYLGWDAFAAKYLVAGDPNNTCVGLRITGGLAPPEPPGAQPTAGSAAAPWQLVPEFAFSIETRMPASGYTVDLGAPAGGQADQNLYDLAPMHQIRVGSELQLTLRPAVTHPAQFLVTPVFSNQPEATWRWSDPDHQAAAANLIRAMTGLSVQAVAILLGKSALIPISTLVTDDVRLALPLPFAGVAAAAATLQGFGVTAESLAAAVAAASTAKTLAGAASLLSGTGVFADARAGVGTPAAGLSAVAVGALESARSAPPLLAPITTGLSMKPVGLAAPPQIFHVPAVAPVVLAQPRLHSVLQSLPQPVSDVPPPARTTVANLQAALSAPRTSAPRLQVVPGARLAKMAPPTAPRPTAAAVTARSLRNPEVAALVGTAHARGFADAGKLVLGNGVALPAGTTHFWELPGVGTATLTCAAAAGAGAAAVRVTSFNRGLQVIDDRELATAKTAAVQLPAGATAVAVTGLGRPGVEVAAGFGAASFASAPPGGVPAVGWQAGNLAVQIGPSTLLARGAVIALPVASRLWRNRQSTSYAMTRIAAAVVEQPGVETWLPAVTPVVMVLLDQQDSAATLDGDLGIAVRGGTLAGAPVVVAGGTRIALLYDVTVASPAAPYLAVAVASRSGWRLSGVVGLHGSAVDQAVRMHGGVPPQIVPDGPLTADGQSQVSLRIEAP